MSIKPLDMPTLLDRIDTEIRARLDLMRDEDDEVLWNNQYSGDATGQNAIATPYYALLQGPEETLALVYPYEDKKVAFYLQFRWNKYMDLDNMVVFRYYLGKLQARLFGNHDRQTLGGLSINVLETGNNPEIEGQSDSTPAGMLMFEVIYRMRQGDPYHTPAEIEEDGLD